MNKGCVYYTCGFQGGNTCCRVDLFEGCYLIHTKYGMPFPNEYTHSEKTLTNRANHLSVRAIHHTLYQDSFGDSINYGSA